MMIDPTLQILGVMTFAGILGGAINYFLIPVEDAPTSNIVKSITIGIGASMMVPLFLNMISSSIIDQVLGKGGNPGDPSKLLILTGFCLVASVSSRAFIKTLSERVLNEVREAKAEARSADEEVKRVKSEMQPIIEKETETESSTGDVQSKSEVTLTDSEKSVLEAFLKGSYTMRSISGIAKDTGMSHFLVQQVLKLLIEKKLVSETSGRKGPKWYLTGQGREVLGASNQGASS